MLIRDCCQVRATINDMTADKFYAAGALEATTNRQMLYLGLSGKIAELGTRMVDTSFRTRWVDAQKSMRGTAMTLSAKQLSFILARFDSQFSSQRFITSEA